MIRESFLDADNKLNLEPFQLVVLFCFNSWDMYTLWH